MANHPLSKTATIVSWLLQNGTDKPYAEAKAALGEDFSDRTFRTARQRAKAKQAESAGSASNSGGESNEAAGDSAGWTHV